MADKAAGKQNAFCHICSIYCSSAFQLCEHVIGSKHRSNAKRVSPDCLPHAYRLQYFFDTYMKLDPLVGLEYVEEMQEANGYQHKYKCLLCGFYGDRKLAYQHVTGAHHVTNFIDKHYPDFSVNSAMYPNKNEYVKAVQEAAAKAYADRGRQKITETVIDRNASPTPQKTSKPSSAPKTAKKTVPAASSHRNGDPNAKSLRYLEKKRDGGQQEERLSGFSGNGDFLEYLQKFEIRSDEDAWLIRRIMQNCTRALERFRQEQVRQSRDAPRSREAPPPAYRTTNKGANVVAPAASQPQNDSATALFFSSIKNMEESEVVDILRNIAATNPAFRGIDVPNAMKYLQATGRLKTS